MLSIDHTLDVFSKFRESHSEDYDRAFCSTSILQLSTYFVNQELLFWNPFFSRDSSYLSLHSMQSIVQYVAESPNKSDSEVFSGLVSSVINGWLGIMIEFGWRVFFPQDAFTLIKIVEEHRLHLTPAKSRIVIHGLAMSVHQKLAKYIDILITRAQVRDVLLDWWDIHKSLLVTVCALVPLSDKFWTLVDKVLQHLVLPIFSNCSPEVLASIQEIPLPPKPWPRDTLLHRIQRC
jgi:hypothetical protein